MHWLSVKKTKRARLSSDGARVAPPADGAAQERWFTLLSTSPRLPLLPAAAVFRAKTIKNYTGGGEEDRGRFQGTLPN